jgi:hypothetical protein
MHQRLLLLGGFTIGLVVFSLTHISVEGQTGEATSAAKPATAAKPWTPMRTADGQPDLQGVWTNATPTPFERRKELGDKAFYTDEEYAKMIQPRGGNAPADAFSEHGQPLRQTSLIIDPPNGRLPELTEEAKLREKQLQEVLSKRGGSDSYTDRNNSERCLSRGAPKLPGIYNANFQIYQSKDYVAILQEMIHEVRIIPLDGRAHFDKNVHFWLGDSVGHWEGDTLVVDNTNYNDELRNNIYNCCGLAGTDLHVVERFKRVDANTIDYRYTVDAPETYVKPFTASVPLKKAVGPVFEYACHEGNYALHDMLAAGRLQDKLGIKEARDSAADHSAEVNAAGRRR